MAPVAGLFWDHFGWTALIGFPAALTMVAGICSVFLARPTVVR